jgi:hypothetical protein
MGQALPADDLIAFPIVENHPRAQLYTSALLQDLRTSSKGDPALAVQIGFSAFAAVEVLFNEMGIAKDDFLDLYAAFWAPIVARMSANSCKPELLLTPTFEPEPA